MAYNKWPENVPVLSGADFCRRQFKNGNGQCCLLGWARETFPRTNRGDTPKVAINALKKNIPYKDSSIVDYNDNYANPLDDLAKVWNSAMKDLGYTEETEI